MKTLVTVALMLVLLGQPAEALECIGKWQANQAYEFDFVFTSAPREPYGNWVRGSANQTACPGWQMMHPESDYYMLFEPRFEKQQYNCQRYVGTMFAADVVRRTDANGILTIDLKHCREVLVRELPQRFAKKCHRIAANRVVVDKAAKTAVVYSARPSGEFYRVSKVLRCR